jgi:hypothetical protein
VKKHRNRDALAGTEAKRRACLSAISTIAAAAELLRMYGGPG